MKIFRRLVLVLTTLIAIVFFFSLQLCFAQGGWVARYNGPGNGNELILPPPNFQYGFQSRTIAIDVNGNVYITGSSQGNGTGYDYATIKYDSHGSPSASWPDVGFGVGVRRYNGLANGQDHATSVTVDNAGSVYVTGFSDGDGSNIPGRTHDCCPDYATIKYDSNGTLSATWPDIGFGVGVRRYNGPLMDSADYAVAIVLDNVGNVYVTGTSSGGGCTPSNLPGSCPSSSEDYATIKYDSSGNPSASWPDVGSGTGVRRYNSPHSDLAWAIAVDNSGNVYVTGGSQTGTVATHYDYLTIKYDSNGNPSATWPDAGFGVGIRRYDGPASSVDVALTIALDGSGNLYITGTSVGDFSNANSATIKYDPNGNPSATWPDVGFGVGVRRYSSGPNKGDNAGAIKVDAFGNVYVVGGNGRDPYSDYSIIKYGADGNPSASWPDVGFGVGVRRYDGPVHGSDVPVSVAVDNLGNVYVSGFSDGGFGPIPATSYDYATIKYDVDGNPSISWPDVGFGVGVRRYNGTTGNGQDYAQTLILDQSANVYVTGYSQGTGTGFDFATIKIAANGASDGDGDGIPDSADNCILLNSSDLLDSDGDGRGDACDNCAGIFNPGQEDLAFDGAGDVCDQDDDNDGVPDTADNCPIIGNSNQQGTDNDLLGDACDADDDNDGILDTSDNCPLVTNTNQINSDGDWKGDACDADFSQIPQFPIGFQQDNLQGGVAVNPVTNRVYSDTWNEGITVFDGVTNSVIGNIKPRCCADSGILPNGIVVNSVSNRIYALLGSALVVIDGDTNTELAPIATGRGRNSGIAVNSVTNRIYVWTDLGRYGEPNRPTLLVVDGATNSVVTTIDVATMPSNSNAVQWQTTDFVPMAVNTATNRIYVLGYQQNWCCYVEVVDGATNAVLSTLYLGDTSFCGGSCAVQIAVNPVTNRIYVPIDPNQVAVIDGATNSVLAYVGIGDPIFNGGNIAGIVVNTTTNRIYATIDSGRQPPERLAVVDGETNSLLSYIDASTSWAAGGGGGLAINSTTGRIYYQGQGQGTLNGNVLTVVDVTGTFTQAGANVVVQPLDPTTGTAPATLEFTSVTQAGHTTVTTSNQGATPAPGFKTGDPAVFYDISSTATFSGPITLCFSWTEGQFANENTIRLFHYDNGAWADITTSVDTTANKVCGQSYSFSPFALFESAYTFTGFFQPVDNAPIYNRAKAGSAVPVKFSLAGYQGMNILSTGSPSSQPVTCGSASVDDINQTVTASNSSLNYDAASGQYTYVWKTDKAWAGTCRKLSVSLNDRTSHIAYFTFTK